MANTDEPVNPDDPKREDKAAKPGFILMHSYLHNPDGTKEVKEFQYEKDSLSADELTDILFETAQQHCNQLGKTPTDEEISAARDEVREIIRRVIEHSDNE